MSDEKQFILKPIGTVHASDAEQSYILQIDEPYRAGLKQVEQFSHISIFWWADRMDTEQQRGILTTELPYAPVWKRAFLPAARNIAPILLP